MCLFYDTMIEMTVVRLSLIMIFEGQQICQKLFQRLG